MNSEEAALQEAKQRVADLTVIGMRDNLKPDQRQAVREAEVSARAEVKLRRKALEHAQTQPLPSEASPQNLPQDPTTPSPTPSPDLSTKPETSGSTTSTLPKM